MQAGNLLMFYLLSTSFLSIICIIIIYLQVNSLLGHLQKQLKVHLPRDFLFLSKCVGSLLLIVSLRPEKSY